MKSLENVKSLSQGNNDDEVSEDENCELKRKALMDFKSKNCDTHRADKQRRDKKPGKRAHHFRVGLYET